MTADCNGWADMPEAEREALDVYEEQARAQYEQSYLNWYLRTKQESQELIGRNCVTHPWRCPMLWFFEWACQYECGSRRYFTTEGKAYKALMGSLSTEYDDLPGLIDAADEWWIGKLTPEA